MKQSLQRRAFRIKQKDVAGWALMLPSLVLFAFFIWVPLFQNFAYAFSRTQTVLGQGYVMFEFVGFDNFKAAVTDYRFLIALKNTGLYTLFSVLIGFLIPIILGLLLSEITHAKSLFRVGLYMPAMVSGVAAAYIWQQFFEAGDMGFFNVILHALGAEKLFGFTSNSNAVIPLIVVMMTWKGAGATVLIYLAQLQTTDNQQYEAARIDGANAFQRIWFVTLPHLLGMIRILFVLQLISVFQVFQEPFVMTNGGPDNASISLLFLAYSYAFQDAEPGGAGRAAAMSILTAAMIMVFTVVYLYLTRVKKEERV